MKSLLEYSYMNVKELNYENSIDAEGLEKDIYDKIVEKARYRIRKDLKKQMNRLILRTIYLIRTKDLLFTIEEILGNLHNYQKSLWRIAMIHAVSSFVLTKTKSERIKDVIETCDNYLPYNGTEKERSQIVNCLLKIKMTENPDIYQYIDVYYSFGKYLLP